MNGSEMQCPFCGQNLLCAHPILESVIECEVYAQLIRELPSVTDMSAVSMTE